MSNKHYPALTARWLEPTHSQQLRSNSATPIMNRATSARLFEIAVQASVANTNAESVDSEHSGFETAKKRLSTLSGQTRSVRLTPQQWQLLSDFHDHDLFIRSRSWGFCSAIFGIGVTIFAIASPTWKLVGDEMHVSTVGLLGCSCLFGLIGLGLATTGACRSELIPRLYYYHSAGECYLVAAAAITVSLALYPTLARACLENLLHQGLLDQSDWTTVDHVPHQLAYTYFLSLISACFLFSSFVCMNLDIIIQSFSRPLPMFTALLQQLIPSCCRKNNRSKEHQSADHPYLPRTYRSVSIQLPLSGPTLEQSMLSNTMLSTTQPNYQKVPQIKLSDYDRERELEQCERYSNDSSSIRVGDYESEEWI